MKQQLVNSYSSGNNGRCAFAGGPDEFAEPDGWEGYEFWSMQIEAQMESLFETQRPKAAEREPVSLGFSFGKEREGDVLPF